MIGKVGCVRALAFGGLLVGSLVAAAPAMAQPVLDKLFEGMDEGCRRSQPFQSWQDSLVTIHVPVNGGTAPPFVPAELVGIADKARAVDKPEWVEVTAPLAGTFRGLAVKQMVFSFGKENGIYAYALEFAVPRKDVEAALGKRVAKSAKIMKAEAGEFEATTGLDFKGRVALWCDFSN